MRINKCLVTGATGFIGFELAAQLVTENVDIIAMARNKQDGQWSEFVEHDFNNEIGVDSGFIENVDCVFHLAGIAHAESTDFTWDDYYQINVKTTKQLVDLAGRNGVKKFVFVSSVKACADSNGESIDGASIPLDHYGKSKYLAEKAVAEVSDKYNMDYVIVRPTLVYGPKIKGNLLKMIQAIDKGRFPSIPKVMNKRSLVHVTDLCRALILVASNEEANGNTYVVSDLKQYSTRDIYEAMMVGLGKPLSQLYVPKFCFSVGAKMGDMLEKMSGRRMPLNSDSMDKLFGPAFYDGSEICRQLDFKPEWTLERAMPQIVESYRKPSPA